MKFILATVLFFANCLCINAAKKPYLLEGEEAKHRKWRIVWSDKFSSSKKFDRDWTSENAAPSHIQSSRWRENITIKNGLAFITNRKEKRGGKDWTSGSITCKKKFLYGFFECRMKISNTTGVNNAFWMYQWGATDSQHAFELDIAEIHFPNKIQTNIQDRGYKGNAYVKQYTERYNVEDKDLSNEFHTYGVWWTPDSISFYVDGKSIRKTNNTYCHQMANLVLGTAVMPWAGTITESINGSSMIVDYVKVWKEK